MSEKKRKNPVRESVNFPINDPWTSSALDFNPYSNYAWTTGGIWGGAGVNSFAFSAQYDQGYGYVKPVYLTTYQLKLIRERSRQLAFYNEYCAATIKIFQDYVVGEGLKYKVIPTSDNVNQKLVNQTQELIDLYCEHNQINNFENEFIWRLLVEGEYCVRGFEQSNGLITIRAVEPDLILPPSDSNDPDISFGISCRSDDIHDVKGYWIVETPWAGLTPTLVDKSEVNYMKVLTPSNSKRGLPYSFAVDSNYRNAERVLESMISLAISRSKVSMIRKVMNSPPEAVTALTQKTTNISYTDPATQQQLNFQNLPNSSILTTSGNIEYEFPDIQLGSEDSQITLMANLRAICAHYGISEVMLTQNLENGSYSAHQVQESPSFKTFIRWQKLLSEFMCTRRTQPNPSLMWKQVTYAVRKGLLPENALTDVKIIAESPSLLTRDFLKEAQAEKILVDMGVQSKQSVASSHGLDLEEQQGHTSNDNSLEAIVKSVTQLQSAGVEGEQGRKILKIYHPNVDDEVINGFFNIQENNEEKQDLKPKKNSKNSNRPNS